MEFLKSLFNPVFLLAAGLHAGLLLIPLSGASERSVPAPDPEGESITVTRIPPQGDRSQPATTPPVPLTPAAPQPVRPQPLRRAVAPVPARAVAAGSSSRADGRRVAASDTNAQPTSAAEQGGLAALPSTTSPAPPVPPSTSPRPVSASPDPAVPAPAEQDPPPLSALQSGVTSRAASTLKELRAIFTDLRQRYTYSERAMALRRAEKEWLDQVNDLSGAPLAAPEELTLANAISYPLEAREQLTISRWSQCLDPAPEDAVVAVAFDRTGAPLALPQVLRSSGYEALDQLALAAVETYGGFGEPLRSKTFVATVEIAQNESACIQPETLQSVD